MMRLLTPFIGITIALMACAPAAVSVETPGGAGSAVLADSRLSPGDHQLDSGEYYETLSYAGQAGQFVRVTLMSDEFDPYLMVLDPNGERVAEIDDSVGYGHNILVSLNLTMTGSYTMVVTSYKPGETGRFTLEVQADPAGDPVTPVWESTGAA